MKSEIFNLSWNLGVVILFYIAAALSIIHFHLHISDVLPFFYEGYIGTLGANTCTQHD